MTGLEIKEARKKIGLTQEEFAKKIGVTRQTVVGYEKGEVIPETKKSLLVDVLGLLGDSMSFGRIVSNAKIAEDMFIDLEYIPVKARAGFAEMQQVAPMPFETYRVIRTEIGESFAKQVVIEIDGDSMEPNYTSGSKVRCKEVDPGDWIYINSGVYVVVYSNFFVVKRVKNSPVNGILSLHSDNTETGGNSDVPLSDVRKIWKVMRIVDAPAR